MVSLGPVPIGAFVLADLASQGSVPDAGVIVAYMLSFAAFVVFVEFHARHRDEEMLQAARTEEAERSADLLRVSEERFRLISRATNDLIWDADLKSGRIWWNDTLLDEFGYDPKSFENDMTAWETWVHPDDLDRVVDGLQAVIDNNGTNWASEYRFVCADGRIIDVVDRALVLRDELGEPVRIIGTTTDVTEFRALEKRLRHSQKLEAVGQLTGGVAHDFNNLLTIILGSADALSDIHAKDPEAKQLAEYILQAAERGAALTSHLLSFARRQALEPRFLNPKQILSDLDGLISRTITEDIEIEITAAHDVWPIELDPGQLDNAIINLVINARDAMSDGGRVTITASNVRLSADDLVLSEDVQAGRFVMISVSDNGCGMPADVAERAFEPFFTTKEAGKGSGLGLSMVWGFVKQSRGHARVDSEPGQGTSVMLFFPAAQKEDDQHQAGALDPRMIRGTEHILVVEDDDMVRNHVVSELDNLGYTYKEAASGAEALEILEGGATFDLLFTDVVMPGGINGRQLVDEALLKQPNLRVLFTSGYPEEVIVHQGCLDPGVTLLNKPYRRAELAMKIRHVLDN